mgnify:CR=1 FL=1
MLVIKGLTHVYANGTRALENIDLEVGTGMFGLLGPNGAGKSTLMRSVATLQTPTSGSIRFDDIDVIAEPEKLRRTLGYLPQDFGVYPRVSAYDLLDHMAVLKGVAGRADRRETVEGLLNQVNLWDVRKKAVAGYSGGMRQRFGIAQALIGRPELIIVDEPELGLHPYALELIASLFKSAAHHSQILISTQSTSFLDHFDSEDVIVVNREGRESQFLRPDAAKLDAWLDDYSLGEVWEKNVIGGGPH